MLQLYRISVFWNYSRALCHSAEASRPTAGVEDGRHLSDIFDLNMLRHDLLNSKVIANLRFVARVYLCVRFGLPCSSFSTIQHLNKGSRTKDCPEGVCLLVKTRESPTCGCTNP